MPSLFSGLLNFEYIEFIYLQPASALMNAANAAMPTVGDQAAALNLTHSIKAMSTALAELRSASGKAQEAVGFLEVDSALDQLTILDRELEEMRRAVEAGNLVALPGETVIKYNYNKVLL